MTTVPVGEPRLRLSRYAKRLRGSLTSVPRKACPPTVTDPAVLARIAAILTNAGPASNQEGKSEGRQRAPPTVVKEHTLPPGDSLEQRQAEVDMIQSVSLARGVSLGPEDRFPYSTYLGRGLQERLAGMDGNRTHPGRVIGTPQTVLKTAELASATVRRGRRELELRVRNRPLLCALVRGLGCYVGCHQALPDGHLTQSMLPGSATHSHFCPVTAAMRSKSAS
jgi:hypothetical protein